MLLLPDEEKSWSDLSDSEIVFCDNVGGIPILQDQTSKAAPRQIVERHFVDWHSTHALIAPTVLLSFGAMVGFTVKEYSIFRILRS